MKLFLTIPFIQNHPIFLYYLVSLSKYLFSILRTHILSEFFKFTTWNINYFFIILFNSKYEFFRFCLNWCLICWQIFKLSSIFIIEAACYCTIVFLWALIVSGYCYCSAVFWLVIKVCIYIVFFASFLIHFRFRIYWFFNMLLESIKSFIEFFRVLPIFRIVCILLRSLKTYWFFLFLIICFISLFYFLKVIKDILIM